MGLSLLAQASLPYSFWWEAFHTAVYLINKLPSPTTSNKSPHELLFGNIPDYKNLQVFGCACFPFLRPYSQHKLQFRSSKCVFLGYSNHHKGYKCLHPSGKIYLADTVHFNPYEFPYSNLFPTKSPATGLSLPPFSPPTSLSSPPITQNHSETSSSVARTPTPTTSSSSSPPSSSSSSTHHLQSQHGSVTCSPSSSSSLHHNSPTISAPQTTNTHPMVTRAKLGIFKPKIFNTTTTALPKVPDTVDDALNNTEWREAMNLEFQALVDNETWELVPYTDDMKVISNKWIFRVKTKADGTLDKLKARLVARGFEQFAGVDFN